MLSLTLLRISCCLVLWRKGLYRVYWKEFAVLLITGRKFSGRGKFVLLEHGLHSPGDIKIAN